MASKLSVQRWISEEKKKKLVEDICRRLQKKEEIVRLQNGETIRYRLEFKPYQNAQTLLNPPGFQFKLKKGHIVQIKTIS